MLSRQNENLVSGRHKNKYTQNITYKAKIDMLTDERLMYNSVFKSIENIGKFSAPELLRFSEILIPASFKKGAYLLKEKQVCDLVYFINKGSFRHFVTLDDGSEIILDLSVENDWLVDYDSLTSQKPSKNAIQSFEDSEVFSVNIQSFHHLVLTNPTFFQLMRLWEFLQTPYQSNALSPDEKYSQLIINRPAIIQKFPLKYIASYLGITPETLSRIRSRLK